jgi:hypothetical protein
VQVCAESPRRGTVSPELRSCAIANSLADTSAYVCLRVPAPRAPRSSSRRPFQYAPPVPHPHTHACTSSSCAAPLLAHGPCTHRPRAANAVACAAPRARHRLSPRAAHAVALPNHAEPQPASSAPARAATSRSTSSCTPPRARWARARLLRPAPAPVPARLSRTAPVACRFHAARRAARAPPERLPAPRAAPKPPELRAAARSSASREPPGAPPARARARPQPPPCAPLARAGALALGPALVPVEGRERWGRVDKNEAREGMPPVGEKNKMGARGRESREGEVELSQGLVRKFRKLQGSFCKT